MKKTHRKMTHQKIETTGKRRPTTVIHFRSTLRHRHELNRNPRSTTKCTKRRNAVSLLWAGTPANFTTSLKKRKLLMGLDPQFIMYWKAYSTAPRDAQSDITIAAEKLNWSDPRALETRRTGTPLNESQGAAALRTPIALLGDRLANGVYTRTLDDMIHVLQLPCMHAL